MRVYDATGVKTVDTSLINGMGWQPKIALRDGLAARDGVTVHYARGCDVLDAADEEVKTAVLMGLAGISAAEARTRLEAADGYLRRALDD